MILKDKVLSLLLRCRMRRGEDASLIAVIGTCNCREETRLLYSFRGVIDLE